ncbi:hypothetical protein GCM10011490_04560 [Pseudoclavibacter endophyticus]|uniref:DUF3710 domain-containing protein n=1 Tax=Pseudoclavibacter endophyticus TaxID=1778590 RepID=A0A6H9WLK9_9MICO|nr:DUF3710 domain-containing protein [Pseudoclavibacter endophyticus]KAB1650033.1 DUF3710 domain-containing protein [Pseudoclavibacter endophyticus]GGA57793.1 hypothetical protein GCM10011490_04560 [Pseudoclavibacter endophyticus]
MGLLDFLRRDDDTPRQKADRLVADDDLDSDVVADEGDDDDDERFDDKSAPDDREERGPFDVTEANPAKRYVDLGAIRVPARTGLGLRLEVEERTKRLVAVALDYQGSTMQVQAFAAPRSSGLWHPIRRQLVEQVEKQGGQAEEVEAALGTVLDTKLPVAKGASGGVGHRSARFIGVDGPRWFLRGVLTGEALRDEAARDAMEELFRSIVVVRGDEAMPPRELLPLVVPKAMAEHMADAKQPRAAQTAKVAGTVDSGGASSPSPDSKRAEGRSSKRRDG